MSTMEDHALAYAAAGQPVFPCFDRTIDANRRAKAPLTAHGFQDATTDADQIHTWWFRYPSAAIGLPTGIVWDVLDVDNKPGGVNGFNALSHLISEGLVQHAAKIVRTPTNGAHLYYPATGTDGNASFRKFGIDIRGKGGYVVAPPSVIKDVGAYVVDEEQNPLGPLDHKRIRTILRPAPVRAAQGNLTRSEGGSLVGLTNWLASVKYPGRNEALFYAANRAIENGFDPYDLLDAALYTGMDEARIRRTIESAIRTQARA